MHKALTGTRVAPREGVRFEDMPLSDVAREGIAALGYEIATPVQATVFELAMQGQDLMVQSKTGTGKTTAFGLPLVEKMDVEREGFDPQALVLCPTRELAMQVSEEIAVLGDPKGVRVLPVYGGMAMNPQLKALKAGCDVVVGTPGRVLDHVRRRTLRLVHAHLAVLDEADEMLSMGFWEDVTSILDQLPEKRQTLLFSATLPDPIRRTALAQMKEPVEIDISRDELTVEGITNICYETDERLPKPRNLLYVLEVERPESAVIFCNTRDDASILAAFLRRQGLHALALSGELAQKDRERVMRRMKNGELQYLVATDIAARGIDISDLGHVVNYSLPAFTEVYLHRVGRTGRAGKKGTAVSLVSGRDEMTYTELERNYGIEFVKKTLPEFEEINRMQAERVGEELLKAARDTEITSFLRLAEHLKVLDAGTEVIAFLLKGYFYQLEEQRAQEPITLGNTPGRLREPERRPRPTSRPETIGRGREGEREDPGGRTESPGRRRRRRRGANEGGSFHAKGEATRLFINRGQNDGYDERRIRGLLADAADVDEEEALERALLRRSHSFAEVRAEVAEKAIAAAEAGLEREDKPVIIEVARTRG
ncbi:MAG: DEAD/DEAH box helicase [Myxococcales bacterium]|nr:DEAD/DEAH box helicase [Myxococcales bacterium]